MNTINIMTIKKAFLKMLSTIKTFEEFLFMSRVFEDEFKGFSIIIGDAYDFGMPETDDVEWYVCIFNIKTEKEITFNITEQINRLSD